MSFVLRAGFSVSSWPGDVSIKDRGKRLSLVSSSIGSLQFKDSNSQQFLGKTFGVSDHKPLSKFDMRNPKLDPVNAQSSVRLGKAPRWWEKSLQPNMIEIQSAQELVDSLLNAGDRLVIVDFYSPGCGGCKALHPKICQMAEMNPDTDFLMVNYEDHKAMCYALHVHVLPFFRLYRGAEGRVCSFSCTNATIKKFKDALAKYGTDRCTFGPAKGLSDKELIALASIDQISRDMVPSSSEDAKEEHFVLNGTMRKDENKIELKEGNAMAMV